GGHEHDELGELQRDRVRVSRDTAAIAVGDNLRRGHGRRGRILPGATGVEDAGDSSVAVRAQTAGVASGARPGRADWSPSTRPRITAMHRRSLAVAFVFVAGCTLQRVPPAHSPAQDDHMAHMSAADLRAPARVASAGDWQGTPGLPPSNMTAEARLKASPRHAEWV